VGSCNHLRSIYTKNRFCVALCRATTQLGSVLIWLHGVARHRATQKSPLV
jgi:hypothetical protein